MTHPQRSLSRRLFVASATAGLAAPKAFGQAWPARGITLIAPYPAGGGIDTVARLLSERLALRLGQPVTVENKPGAGATIGAAALARAPADGYTLMLGSIVDYAIAPHVHKSLAFDMQKNFVPVIEVGIGTVALIVTGGLTAKTLSEVIALAKSKPGELSFASSGIGGLQHLNAEMFKQMAGIDMIHVPYKGTAQLMPDLLTGRVQVSIDSIPAHLGAIREGKTRALAVASRERSTALPDVPTFAEAGMPGYETATNYTMFAPAGTPAEVVMKLNTELDAIVKASDFAEAMKKFGATVRGGSTAQATTRMATEVAKWADVIKKGNLQLVQ